MTGKMTDVAALLITGLLMIGNRANAGINRWTTRGPAVPGNVTAVLADPHDAAVIYYASDAGVFRTDDGGSSWHAINTGLTELHVSAATIRTDAPATLYVATQSGAVFRTDDGGAFWIEIARLPQTVDALAFDAVHADLYARMGDKIVRSADDGETWTDSFTQTVNGPSIEKSVATLHGNVYAIVRQTLYWSSDQGVTWTALVIPASAFAVDEESGAIVVTSNTGVIRSFNDGKTWQALSGFFGFPEIVLAYKGGVLASNPTSIYRYSDDTQSWAPITGFFEIFRIARAASSPARLFVVAKPSTDEALGLFTVAETGGQAQPIAIDRGNRLAWGTDVAVAGSDVYSAPCSNDGCVNGPVMSKLPENASVWSRLNVSSSTTVFGSAVIALAPNKVIAGMWDGLHKSDDGGETWHKVNSAHVDDFDAFGVSRDGATIYAALSDGLDKSTSGGESWASMPGSVPLYMGYYGFDARVAVDPHSADTAYVSAQTAVNAARLYKTTDGGSHWTPLTLTGPAPSALAIDCCDSSLIYAANGTFERSQDGGMNWEVLPLGCAGAVLTDPVRPSTVYLAGCGTVSRSTDRGDHWDALGAKLPEPIWKLAMNSEGDRLVAGTISGVHEFDFDSSAATTRTVTLAALFGNFVSAANCGHRETQANARFAGPCETLTLIDINGGNLEDGDQVRLQAFNGDFVAAEHGGASTCGGCYSPLVANRPVAREWETFTIHKIGGSGPIIDGDNVSLQSFAGDYVAAEYGGSNACQCDSRLNANRAVAGPWETFRISVQP